MRIILSFSESSRFLVVSVLLLSAGCRPDEQTVLDRTREAGRGHDPLARGLSLFADNCARCHGAHGFGDGAEAPFLYPKPRNFARGNFRLTSTKRGLPTDEDLQKVIREGLPGSAMPPFSHLSEEDREALAVAVRHLATEGKTSALLQRAEERGEAMSPEEARKLAERLFVSGPPFSLPRRIHPSSGTPERGEQLFRRICTSCHGTEGAESPKRDMRDDTGAYIYARNFQSSLFRRGKSHTGIALTILRGLPGTPMPGFALPDEDLWPLVDFVRSLAGEGDETPPLPAGVDRFITLTGIAEGGVWTEESVQVGATRGRAWAPARIVLRQGEEVLLTLKSADVTHRFYSPALGIGPVEVYPGYPRSVRFKAPAPGEYEYFCTQMCGPCHFTMTGSILVMAASTEESARAEPKHCSAIVEVPADGSVVEQGKALFRKMGCRDCHGEEGRGGVENLNALPVGKVPALASLAENLMFWSPTESEVQAVLELLESRGDLHAAAIDPPFARYEIFLRQYDSVRQSIRQGRVTPERSVRGPQPPLQMPAWEARLTSAEIDAIVAYLISLYDWDLPDPIQQHIAFNHRLHIEDAALECTDCHANVMAGPRAGFPPQAFCVDCHDPEYLSEQEIAELRPRLATLTKHLQGVETIRWKQVHKLPEHVTFSHARHVKQAGLDCVLCHGDLARLESPPPRPAFRLNMNWCLDCHRQRQATDDCRACHQGSDSHQAAASSRASARPEPA